MNIKLLQRVKKAILNEPKRFDMSNWFDIHPCGSTACIAGYTCALKESKEKTLTGKIDEVSESWFDGNGLFDANEAEELARKALRLSEDEAMRLFFVSHWPSKFRAPYVKYDREFNQEEMAKVAAERIDHFINTKGKE